MRNFSSEKNRIQNKNTSILLTSLEELRKHSSNEIGWHQLDLIFGLQLFLTELQNCVL